MSLYTENRKAYDHEQYLKNREVRLVANAQWQKKNRKKCRMYMRRWRARHPERNALIIPSLGYVKGNVIVISWRANNIKKDATIDELVKIGSFYQKLIGGES